MSNKMDKILNPSGYGYDPQATPEDYQEVIAELQEKLSREQAR